MGKLKKLLFGNLPLKLLSLLVAFLLWLNITSMQKARAEFYVPVEIRNIPDNVVIIRVKPDKVLVTIEGYKNVVSNLDVSDIKAYVDGSPIKPGTNILKVHIRTLPSLRVIKISPNTIIVKASIKKERD